MLHFLDKFCKPKLTTAKFLGKVSNELILNFLNFAFYLILTIYKLLHDALQTNIQILHLIA